MDHVVSVVDGGSNDDTNLATSCRDCNLGKGPLSLSVARDPWDSEYFHPGQPYVADPDEPLLGLVEDDVEWIRDLHVPSVSMPWTLPSSLLEAL